MIHRYIKDLNFRDQGTSTYLLKSKNLRDTSKGTMFLDLVLSDSSGEIVAKKWDATDAEYDELVEGEAIQVSFSVDRFKDELNMKIEAYFPTGALTPEEREYLVPVSDV